ncbi:MAG: branched-chain amino acid ABC transporter permease [Magnetovibrionaceae bacterium]
MPVRIKLLLGLSALLFLALPPLTDILGNPFWLDLARRIVIYAIAAVSLDLILGYGGLVSFGHAAFFGLGGYAVGILAHHASERTGLFFIEGAWTGSAALLVQLPVAVLVAGLFALVIGALSLRTSGIYFIMITLAFAQMLYFFFTSLTPYGGEDGLNIWERSSLPGLDLYDDWTFYYLCLGLLFGQLIVFRRLTDSRFGRVLRAIKRNEARVRALGIPTNRYKLAAFVIAGAGAGLAGALIANHTEFIGPGLMHWTRSGEIMIMVILGGMGTLFGPVLGAAALLILEDALASWTEHWMIFLGPILLGVVLFARAGLWGLLAGKEGRDG